MIPALGDDAGVMIDDGATVAICSREDAMSLLMRRETRALAGVKLQVLDRDFVVPFTSTGEVVKVHCQEYVLNCTFVCVQGLRTLVVSTPVLLYNETPIALFFHTDKDSTRSILSLDPLRSKCIPHEHCRAAALYVSASKGGPCTGIRVKGLNYTGDVCEPMSGADDSTSDATYWLTLHGPKPSYVIAVVRPHLASEVDKRIEFSPVVVIENLLAIGVYMRLRPTADDKGSLALIASGIQLRSVAIHPRSHCYLSVSLDGELHSPPIRVDGYDEDSQTSLVKTFVHVPCDNGATLLVNVEVEYKNGARIVRLFVPFWCVSLSRQNVLLRHDEMDDIAVANGFDNLAGCQMRDVDDNVRLAVSSVLDQQGFDTLPQIAIIGYTSTETDSVRLAIKLGATNWSRSFPAGYQGAISLDVHESMSTNPSLLSWLGFDSNLRYGDSVVHSL
jgi:hypothetical protein